MSSTIRVNCQVDVHYIWLDKYDEIVELWYGTHMMQWSGAAHCAQRKCCKVNGFYKRA